MKLSISKLLYIFNFIKKKTAKIIYSKSHVIQSRNEKLKSLYAEYKTGL